MGCEHPTVCPDCWATALPHESFSYVFVHIPVGSRITTVSFYSEVQFVPDLASVTQVGLSPLDAPVFSGTTRDSRLILYFLFPSLGSGK